MVKLDIDTTNFNRAIQQIAKYSGADLVTVVESEAQAVLTKAAGFTKSASASRIRENHNRQKATRADVGNGSKLYFLDNRYPNPMWSRLKRARAASLKRKLAARGLAKQSWAQLAYLAGLSITVPAYVLKAVASTGRTYPENVTASRLRKGRAFGIFFENAQPTANLAYVGGPRAVQRAINGRVKFFARNMEKGVFTSLRKIAAAYPGLRLGS
jgi:hypothetical protein